MISILNLEALETLKMLGQNNPGFLPKIIQVYLTDTASNLAKLRELLAKGDAQGLAFHAHALRSSSENVGAAALADLCSKLEHLGRSGSLENADALVTQIFSVFEETQKSLQKYL